MVELAAVEVEAADQRVDRAIVRVDGDEGRLRFRQLHDLPDFLVVLLHPDDRPAADLFLRQGLLVKRPGDEFQAFARNRHRLARARHGADLLCVRGDDHGSQHVVVVAVFGQRLVIVVLVGVVGQLGERFRPAVAMAPVVVEDAAPQRRIGGFLVGLADRRVDAESPRVHIVRILLLDRLAYHFGDVLGMERELARVALDAHGRLRRLGILFLGHVAKLPHAAKHVELALLGPLRIDYRVKGGRRLGQPGQHGRFGEGQLVEGLAKVDLRRGGEAVRALAEVDLVDVKLEDLVFLEAVLDLEREHCFVELARKRLLGRQEKIPRDLHRDGAGALPSAARCEVGYGGAHDALVVDACMLVEALILGREDRPFEDLGHLGDLHHGTPLLAELADQHALGGIHAQRDLRLVVGENLERRQVGPGEDDDQTDCTGAYCRNAREQSQRKGQKTKPHQCDRYHLEGGCTG